MTKSPPRRNQWRRLVSAMLAPLMLAACGQGEGQQAARSAPSPPPEPVRPYETTVSALEQDYSGNEVATDQKIDGRPVLVRGTIQSVEKDFLSNPVIAVRGANPFMPARMTLFSDEMSLAGTLKKGQRVGVLCGRMQYVVGIVAGNDCRVLEGP